MAPSKGPTLAGQMVLAMGIIPVPFQKFEIKSDLPPDEVVETVRRGVTCSNFWCWECENRYHLEMKRKFDFDLRRAKPSVHLRVRAQPPGSIIDVKIQFGPFNGLVFF